MNKVFVFYGVYDFQLALEMKKIKACLPQAGK